MDEPKMDRLSLLMVAILLTFDIVMLPVVTIMLIEQAKS